MSPLIRVHRILPLSLANGPGRRFVLWVRGCCFRCEGCFNGEAQGAEGGRLLSPRAVREACDASVVEGLTISGGEPLLQAEGLLPLLQDCRREGLNTMVYTGFSLSALKAEGVSPAVRALLGATDLLIDGPFRRDLPPDGEWVGSGNQRVIPLSREGMAMKKRRKTAYVEQEYILSREGEFIQTGI